MGMFDRSVLLGNDMDKWSRVDNTNSQSEVSVKEEVIKEMTLTLIIAMLERKSNGSKYNDKALQHLIQANLEFTKDLGK